MALHTGTLGGLGQVGGPLETAGGASGGGAGGGGLTSDPLQASTLTTAAHPPAFIKYAATPYAPPVGDPYANGGSGGGGLIPYTDESAGQPPPVAPTSTIQMQQFPPQSQSQRLVQPPAIIDTGMCDASATGRHSLSEQTMVSSTLEHFYTSRGVRANLVLCLVGNLYHG